MEYHLNRLIGGRCALPIGSHHHGNLHAALDVALEKSVNLKTIDIVLCGMQDKNAAPVIASSRCFLDNRETKSVTADVLVLRMRLKVCSRQAQFGIPAFLLQLVGDTRQQIRIRDNSMSVRLQSAQLFDTDVLQINRQHISQSGKLIVSFATRRAARNMDPTHQRCRAIRV